MDLQQGNQDFPGHVLKKGRSEVESEHRLAPGSPEKTDERVFQARFSQKGCASLESSSTGVPFLLQDARSARQPQKVPSDLLDMVREVLWKQTELKDACLLVVSLVAV